MSLDYLFNRLTRSRFLRGVIVASYIEGRFTLYLVCVGGASSVNKMDIPEIDPNFEPQMRARSNTWPVRPKDLAEEEAARTPSSNEGDKDIITDIKQEKPTPPGEYGLNKKAGGSRRNAWGNLSYADLITKAIQSSPECRLTLSQIYDWMVQNVPYFRDKGDSNSSAGWKVNTPPLPLFLLFRSCANYFNIIDILIHMI